MNSLVTIVAYHYVRDLKRSRFPDIKGLDTKLFRGQIDYIQTHYNVISGDDLLAAIWEKAPLPPRSLLLTFDDGYLDHYETVFPILNERNLKGCFFVPAQCLTDNAVLDINKIHYVLSAVQDKNQLVDYLLTAIDEHRNEFSLQNRAHYWETWAIPNRFDPKEVIFIKRMLQTALPEPLRKRLIQPLFSRYVSSDEATFAHELYMSETQLKELVEKGMTVGSHGYSHQRLDRMSLPDQENEIRLSLKFLNTLGISEDRWTLCYPHGTYNEPLLQLLEKYGCRLGLSTEVALADLQSRSPLALPRLDTNDLPQTPEAIPNSWTQSVSEITL